MATNEDSDADFPPDTVYTRQTSYIRRMMFLDDAQLPSRCPLDNGRHTGPSKTAGCTLGRLQRFPTELMTLILAGIDIPSLTAFRRVNRCAMELVDSIPQYAAIIEHCPDVLRATLSLRASAFSCDTLYNVLTTSRCATCERFGDRVYLIDCCRVCEHCANERPEFQPLEYNDMWRAFGPMPRPKEAEITRRRNLLATRPPPSILSLPGNYNRPLFVNNIDQARTEKRFVLFDQRFVTANVGSLGLDWLHGSAYHKFRRMAIITAPQIPKSGSRADWGFYCLACKDLVVDGYLMENTKYTRQGMSEHLAKLGPVEPLSTPIDSTTKFRHVTPA